MISSLWWAIWIVYIVMLAFVPLSMTKIIPLNPIGWFDGPDVPPTTFSNTNMMYETCNTYNNTIYNKILHYRLNYSLPSCESYEPDYTKHITAAYIHIAIDITILAIMIVIFADKIKLYRRISKLLMVACVILVISSICANVYWLPSKNLTNWMTNATIYDIDARIYIGNYSVPVYDQFAFMKTICQVWEGFYDYPVNVTLTRCERNNDMSIVTGSVIKIIAAIVSCASGIYIEMNDREYYSYW